MKRALLTLLSLVLIVSVGFAGGMVTNGNQSSEYIRTLNRNATYDVDAVYFNPAAVSSFGDGFHLYISNQTIFQTRTVIADFPTLNSDTFEGTTFAPAFPNLYVAWVNGALGVSGGFMPIGGGGSAEFPDGLPAFETTFAGLAEGVPASALDPQLSALGTITGYDVDAAFEGSSLYLGFQGGVSYKIMDMLSVYAGFRYVSAKNTYLGHLKNIVLNTSSGMDLDGSMAELLMDMEVDAEKTGTGSTLIFAANVVPFDALNVTVRYETLTELETTNSTTVDDVGMFPDGESAREDMPAQLSLGLGYRLSDALWVEGSYNYWFNADADWDGRELFVENNFETGVALEYMLSEKLAVSCGFLMNKTGAEDKYNTDISHSLSSNSVAGGGKYILGEDSFISLGLFNVFYEDGNNYAPIPKNAQTYQKTTVGFSIGYQRSF